MIDPHLHAQARVWIARLELVSNGTTFNFDPEQGRDDARTVVLPAHGHHPAPRDAEGYRDPMGRDPEFLVHRRHLTRATTNDDLRAIIKAAKADYRLLTRATPPQGNLLEPGSIHLKRHIANSPKTGEALAREFSVSRKTVQAYRRDYRDKDAA